MKTVNIPYRCGNPECKAMLGIAKDGYGDEIEVTGFVRVTKYDLLNALQDLEDDDDSC